MNRSSDASDPLAGLPVIRVEIVEDRSPPSDGGFLRVRRLLLRNHYENGRSSHPYVYDIVDRDALDAVAIVIEAESLSGDPTICVRSSLRPPLALRGTHDQALGSESISVQWEIPAGLVEPSERSMEGLRVAAAREAYEETGVELTETDMLPLGPRAVLTPGMVGETVHFFHTRIDTLPSTPPPEDGSPVEAGGIIRFVPLYEILLACRDGRIRDIKTEIGARRLAERLGVR